MAATGALRSRKLQRLLNLRWWETSPGQSLRVRSIDPFEIEPGPDTVGIINTDTTFQIPSDYATLQDAIDDLADRVVVRGVAVTLNIESGHALTGGVLLEAADYSMFRISSDDATVPLDAAWVGVSDDDMTEPGGNRSNAWMIGAYCHLPVVDTTIDMGGKGDAGIYLPFASVAHVTLNGGVINSGGVGIEMRASVVRAERSTWDGAASSGIRCTQGSIGAFQQANAASCNSNADGNGAVFSSRGATLVFQQGSCPNSGDAGLRCQRAYLNGQNADASGAADQGAMAQIGGWMVLRLANLSGAGTNGIEARAGTTINAERANVSNCTRGVWARRGGRVVATDGDGNPVLDATGCELGLYATEGGEIIAPYADCSGYVSYGVNADNGYINVAGGNLSSAADAGVSTAGLRARNGSTVVATTADCRQAGTSTDPSDITCESGSIVHAYSADGGTSKTANALDRQGIIFQ